ncbi:MAG: ABC transporter permease [Eubacterium sp.]|jgi:ribose transport system permease protein|nr:ABC transporter permease [Eubacterium sp.]
MKDNAVEVHIHPLKRVYVSNKELINTLIMCICVLVISDVIVGIITGNFGVFLSVKQTMVLLRMSSFTALFGLCQMIVICVGDGGLDLSVGYIASLSSILAGHIMEGSNAGIVPAVIVAILVGGGFGLLNGFFKAYLGLPALVVTMAMASIIQGICYLYTTYIPISGAPGSAISFLTSKFTGIMPNILLLLIPVTVVVEIIFRKTKLGVKLLGIGSNDVAAFLSGVNVKRTRMLAFMASGIIAALCGIVLLGYFDKASMDLGTNYVMPSIVCVVIGGVSINGGKAGYIPVIFGAFILQVLNSLFVSIGWGDAGKWLGFGLILLVMLIIYVRNKMSR